VRQITQPTLEAFGYRVLLAEDGTEAVSLFVAKIQDIALVLTNMMMPMTALLPDVLSGAMKVECV